MNFKHIFPTFRNRYLFVQDQLKSIAARHDIERALNLGTGEGDYDSMIAGYCKELIGCDVNAEDLAHARALNKGVMNLKYELNNALDLSYPDAHFDLVVSSEVIEHVGDPGKMMSEIFRVLKPGGYVVMTFPSKEFPFTYDPINRTAQWLRPSRSPEYLIHQGAYAFGHDYLIPSDAYKNWVTALGFEVHAFYPLSGSLVGFLEMYWTGWVQRLFKKNSGNVDNDGATAVTLRPGSNEAPGAAAITDGLLWIDRELLTGKKYSVGKGVVLFKPEPKKSTIPGG